ncbi:MAG: hypothetical protein J7L91_01645, partial [Candidatus Korarchaeota archaeon]|nr:hypothetical protein [Candidatus Korarchaeota archaeon]
DYALLIYDPVDVVVRIAGITRYGTKAGLLWLLNNFSALDRERSRSWDFKICIRRERNSGMNRQLKWSGGSTQARRRDQMVGRASYLECVGNFL